MNTLGWIHLLLAVLAIIIGSAILLSPKGTRRHRQTGHKYVFAMLGLNVSALMIYRLFGYFGPFHWAALFSLATLLAGVIPARKRKPRGGWLFLHANMMAWSYIGLLAAAVSEVSTRYLDYPFGKTVLLSSCLVFLAGGLVIGRKIPTTTGRMSAQPAKGRNGHD